MKILRDLLPLLAEIIDLGTQSTQVDLACNSHDLNKSFNLPFKKFSRNSLYVLAREKDAFNNDLLINLALEVGVNNGLPTIIFTPKGSTLDIAFALLSEASKIPLDRLKVGQLNVQDWNLLTEGIAKLVEADIFIDDCLEHETTFIQKLNLARMLHDQVGIILITGLTLSCEKIKLSELIQLKSLVDTLNKVYIDFNTLILITILIENSYKYEIFKTYLQSQLISKKVVTYL